jgi:hypothetical protein
MEHSELTVTDEWNNLKGELKGLKKEWPNIWLIF